MSRDIAAIILSGRHTINRTRDELTLTLVISNPPHDLLPARGERVTLNFTEPEPTP